jgi:hypothetical protein
MTNVHHNNETEHFPCDCHRPEHAYTDSLCPMCEENAEREREAKREATEHECGRDCDYDPDRGCPMEAEGPEPEYADDAEANNQAFADAAGQMTREDWDSDNDWLASAGWGEM